MRKPIDFSKPGSTARDMGIILAARQCCYVNAMYLRCSAPRFRKLSEFLHNTFTGVHLDCVRGQSCTTNNNLEKRC